MSQPLSEAPPWRPDCVILPIAGGHHWLMEVLTRSSFTVAVGNVVHRLDKVDQKNNGYLEFRISDVIASGSSNQSVVTPPPSPGRENSPASNR
jgi:hypothetical protein